LFPWEHKGIGWYILANRVYLPLQFSLKNFSSNVVPNFEVLKTHIRTYWHPYRRRDLVYLKVTHAFMKKKLLLSQKRMKSIFMKIVIKTLHEIFVMDPKREKMLALLENVLQNQNPAP
jgi:hypothetical protein